MRWVGLVMALATAACGSEGTGEPEDDDGGGAGGQAPEGPCEPGTLTAEDGTCIEAGLTAWPCAPGEHDAGSGCVAPGIAACGDGFDADPALGCVPQLPSAPCPSGEMALVGETTCRPVHPCMAGTWGDIVTDADTQHVDQTFVGVSDGSAAAPWTTIQAGIDAATPDAVVAVAAGTYGEDLMLDRPVTVWGVCPSLVTVEGVSATGYAVTVLAAGAGSTLRGLAVTGPDGGIEADASMNLDRSWLHDTGFIGLLSIGPADRMITVVDSLLERAGGVAIGAAGVTLSIETSVVRDTQPDAQGGFGMAVLGGGDAVSRGSFAATRSVFDGNHSVAIDLESTDAILEECVIQNTQPRADNQERGRALDMTKRDDAEAGTVLFDRVVLRDNRDVGLRVVDSAATVVDSAIVRTAPDLSDDTRGYGILVQSSEAAAGVELSQSLLAEVHGYGILALDADLLVEASLVSDVAPSPGEGQVGRGILSDVSSPAGAQLTVTGSRLERLVDGGILALGATTTLTDVSIVSVAPNPTSGDRGYGIFTQASTVVEIPFAVNAERVAVSQVAGTGFGLIGANATLTDLHVADVAANGGPVDDGYGVVWQQFPAGFTSTGTLSHALVERASLASVLVAGAEVTLRSVAIVDTQPNAAAEGRALQVEVLPSLMLPTVATVQGCRLERHPDGGIVNLGAQVVVENTLIRDIAPGTPARFGGGIVSQRPDATMPPPFASVLRSRVEECDGFGIIDVGGDLVVIASEIVNTTATTALWGDGIAIEQPLIIGGAPHAATAQIRDTKVRNSARGGITNFGASVALSGMRLDCNAFDLNAEVGQGMVGQFADEGDNVCGCGQATGTCKVTSSMLAPPPAQ